MPRTGTLDTTAALADAPHVLSTSGPAAPGEPPEGIAIGNPEQLIRELKKWESTGVDLVNFLLNANETVPQEQVLDSLRLFAREVMPAFADGSK